MTATTPAKVHIFVDNSKLWIEGKKVSGYRQGLPPGTPDYWWRVEYGRLLDVVKNGRTLGAMPEMYGSTPPPNDSLWERIRQQGFDVKLFERNVRGKEKGLDMEMGLDIFERVTTVSSPETILIIAGDADYIPVVHRVHRFGWRAEVWYWGHAAEGLQLIADRFEPLDVHIDAIGFRQPSL